MEVERKRKGEEKEKDDQDRQKDLAKTICSVDGKDWAQEVKMNERE